MQNAVHVLFYCANLRVSLNLLIFKTPKKKKKKKNRTPHLPNQASVQLAVVLPLVHNPYNPNPHAPPLVRPKCVLRL